jgi:hypothetical protein
MLCYLSLRLLLRLAKFFFLLLVARFRYRYGSFVTLLSRRSESDSSLQEYISPFELCQSPHYSYMQFLRTRNSVEFFHIFSFLKTRVFRAFDLSGRDCGS